MEWNLFRTKNTITICLAWMKSGGKYNDRPSLVSVKKWPCHCNEISPTLPGPWHDRPTMLRSSPIVSTGISSAVLRRCLEEMWCCGVGIRHSSVSVSLQFWFFVCCLFVFLFVVSLLSSHSLNCALMASVDSTLWLSHRPGLGLALSVAGQGNDEAWLITDIIGDTVNNNGDN